MIATPLGGDSGQAPSNPSGGSPTPTARTTVPSSARRATLSPACVMVLPFSRCRPAVPGGRLCAEQFRLYRGDLRQLLRYLAGQQIGRAPYPPVLAGGLEPAPDRGLLGGDPATFGLELAEQYAPTDDRAVWPSGFGAGRVVRVVEQAKAGAELADGFLQVAFGHLGGERIDHGAASRTLRSAAGLWRLPG